MGGVLTVAIQAISVLLKVTEPGFCSFSAALTLSVQESCVKKEVSSVKKKSYLDWCLPNAVTVHHTVKSVAKDILSTALFNWEGWAHQLM